jgi:hypothetical protein
MRRQGRGHFSTVLLAAALLAIPLSRPAAAADAAKVLARLGQARGLCVLLEDKECRLALELVRTSDLTVYVQLSSEGDVEAARRAADEAGFYGNRIFVEAGGLPRIHLADNLADAVVAPPGVGGIAKDEASSPSRRASTTGATTFTGRTTTRSRSTRSPARRTSHSSSPSRATPRRRSAAWRRRGACSWRSATSRGTSAKRRP